ncbi:hypothetical protein K438DRAFT_1780841 [Mycena galopus ATCC 62051]|nr:hypothetical protein K438DRAFT_1780841 [Mycena galopus ATCC 62051]
MALALPLDRTPTNMDTDVDVEGKRGGTYGDNDDTLGTLATTSGYNYRYKGKALRSLPQLSADVVSCAVMEDVTFFSLALCLHYGLPSVGIPSRLQLTWFSSRILHWVPSRLATRTVVKVP